MGSDNETARARGPGKGPPKPAITHVADAELVAVVRSVGEGGVEYRYLKQALEEVAIGTMTNLDKKRQLFGAITRKGCVLRRPVPVSYPVHFRTILTLAVLTASPKFMDKQIMGGGWQPSGATGRATVRTFFVSAAMFEFAAEYNRFWMEENSSIDMSIDEINDTTLGNSNYMTAPFGTNPEELVINRDSITRIVEAHLRSSHADTRLPTMIIRTAQNYTQAEIADELGVSAEAVSSAIRRLRRRLH